jgi:hypothetical protein
MMRCIKWRDVRDGKGRGWWQVMIKMVRLGDIAFAYAICSGLGKGMVQVGEEVLWERWSSGGM